jgi:tryptophan-rich hypothetical protein
MNNPVSNPINPKKLLNSKWTAVEPINKQKHFMVVLIEYDNDQLIAECIMQSIMAKEETSIDWRDLKNSEKWLQGWR